MEQRNSSIQKYFVELLSKKDRVLELALSLRENQNKFYRKRGSQPQAHQIFAELG